MKKILLSLFALVVMGIAAKVQAQCTLAIENVNVNFVSSNPISATQCEVTVNVEFDLEYNNGATFVYFNTYLAADYAALEVSNPLAFNCGSPGQPASTAPDAGRLGTSISQVGKSFSDVGLDLSTGHGAIGVPVPTVVLTTYLQDPTVALNTPLNSGGFTVTRTALTATKDHFIITGLKVTINQPCGDPLVAKTDIWASNANAAGAKAQCYLCGVSQSFNDPTITGFKTCNSPSRTFNLGIQTVDAAPKTITYTVYIDMDGDGVIDDDGDLNYNELGEDITAVGPTTVNNFSSATPIALANQTYEPYSSDPVYANRQLIILVEGATLNNSVSKIFPNPVGCIGLPVSITVFKASRSGSNVNLVWQTSYELNNTGFYIERNVNGNWEQVGFVATQGLNGNSSDLLTYSFVDFNNVRGITQYRLRQVDIDGKTKYSEIRSVRGEGQPVKLTVYPNPSVDGRIQVAFDDANAVRNVSVLDMSGRVVRQYNGITNNNITIENLNPGMYTVRVVVPETGAQGVEKIIVNKR